MQSRGTARTPFLMPTKAFDKRRIPPVRDRTSLGSEPRQLTNQSLSLLYLVQGKLGPSLFHDLSRPSA